MSQQSKGKGKASVIEQVAEMAMQLGQRHLADYGATRSHAREFLQRDKAFADKAVRAPNDRRVQKGWFETVRPLLREEFDVASVTA